MALTVPVDVPPRDRQVLASWCRSPSIRAGLALRARIVLLAADGAGTSEIVTRTGASKPTVIAWKRRYAAEGIGGLDDRPKPGRPRTTDDVAIVLATLEPPPERLGVTHWSSRLLAADLGLSNVKVADVWREYGLQPWRRESFKFSTDPQLEAKVRDVVGLYLNPPDKAVVLCVDEKSQVQAVDRTAPILPLRPGLPEKATHDYVRHGTTTLFAALEVATGRVTDACYPRHRHEEFLRFLRHVAKTYPRTELHLVVDNYATHKHPAVQAWLARHPRITLHFTPTAGSWLNMVEIFFGIITRQAIRRGSFTSVRDLITAIETFIDGWNDRCHALTWTRPADELLRHCRPGKRTSFTRNRAVNPLSSDSFTSYLACIRSRTRATSASSAA
jgi:transposase